MRIAGSFIMWIQWKVLLEAYSEYHGGLSVALRTAHQFLRQSELFSLLGVSTPWQRSVYLQCELCCCHFYWYRAAWNEKWNERWEFCPSVCLSNAWIVTKRNKDLSRFLYLVLWEKNVWWEDTFYLKFWVNRPPLEKNADFEPIFARSASAVTPSEKSPINTNRKSSTRFPMSPRWNEHRTLTKVSRIWIISCDISETVRDRMSVTINH